MSNPIPENALVVVADGGKALMFRRTGSGSVVTLHEEQQMVQDAMTEQGPSGSRPEEQTPKQTNEAGFANRLAHALHTMHQHGAFKDLVLVLDPQTLGQLRSSLHKTVEATVVRSIAKDLTNHPQKAIEAALSD
jgi:protein required for attachment to host cells